MPAHIKRQNLQAVADAKQRATERLQQFGIGPRRAFLINRRRTAGKNQAFRLSRYDSFNWRVERKDFAINARFTNATSYELSVLRSKVKYYDGFVLIFRYQKRTPLRRFKCVKQMSQILNRWIIRFGSE